MKNFKLLLTLFFSLFVHQAWCAEGNNLTDEEGFELVDGVHFVTLKPSQQIPLQHKEVREVFFYGCVHCFHLEKVIHEYLKSKPADVTFLRMPAVFNNPSWKLMSDTYYAFNTMGILEKTHGRFFSALHEQKLKLFTPKDIGFWLEQQGLAKGQDFEKTIQSFSVQQETRKAAQWCQKLDIDGVPELIINGKYKTSMTMTHGNKDLLLKVIGYLQNR